MSAASPLNFVGAALGFGGAAAARGRRGGAGRRGLPRLALGLVAGVIGLVGADAKATPTLPGALQNPLGNSNDCAECHAFPNSAATKDQPLVAPIAWQGSLMGNAARDPIFWAGVAIADQDEPGGTEECVRCHAPRAFVAGRGDAIAVDELDPDDRGGVDCDLCHRLIDDGVTPAGDARYVIDDLLAPDGKVAKHGPWSYQPGEEPMHSWTTGEFLATARACGTCHDVTTASMRVDDQGQPTGALFNEQRTYSEWLASDYGPGGGDPQSCQDCHMPAVTDVAGCGKYASEEILHATGGRRHDLAGGNRFIIDVFTQLFGDAGSGEVPDVFFQIAADNIDRTLAAAATLEVVAPAAVDLAQGIDALTVTVTNESGHKLPTGYSEGRVMWIEVTGAFMGEALFASGRWLPGEGPEADDQLHTYEARAVNFASKEKFHLLRNNYWEVDSRLPPKGLQADPETDPVGDRYALQADQTWPHVDAVTYAFAPTSAVDPTPDDPSDDLLDLRVRLLYLVNTPEYLNFLADENHINAAGADAFDAFEAAGGVTPAVLAEWSASVPLSGLSASESSSTSGETTGGSSSTTGGSGTSAGESDTAATSTATATGGSATTSAGGDDAGGGGCACASAGDSRGTGWLGVIVLLGFAGRWRRRRS